VGKINVYDKILTETQQKKKKNMEIEDIFT